MPTAQLGEVTSTAGVSYVHVTTTTSLRDGVLFIVSALPKAG